MTQNKEVRNIKGIEIRSEEPDKVSRTVCGYAIRFNEPSLDLGFTEIISPDAISQEQINSSDIFCYYNHDTEKVLARSVNGEGTLHLEVRDDGVYFEFESPNTEAGNELLEHIKRGELFGTSFGFALDPENSSDNWEKRDDQWYRTIHHIDYLFEVSPVFSPAYPSTSCQQRNTDKINEMDKTLNNLENLIEDIEHSVDDYNINLDKNI